MPSTARLRGLGNAFRPADALAYSAEYVRFLTDKFGNLGLAAAAYNSGEGRVTRWLSNGGFLPAETRNYVRTVTGASVEAWRDNLVVEVDYALNSATPFQEACVAMAEASPTPILTAVQGNWKPWGVLIAQHFSASVATTQFNRASERFASLFEGEQLLMLTVQNPSFGRTPRHSAMLGRDNRDQAEDFCDALRKVGGGCIVVRN